MKTQLSIQERLKDLRVENVHIYLQVKHEFSELLMGDKFWQE